MALTSTHNSRRSNPFTLLELLVAAFCMAVLLAALSVPVRGALRERERARDDAAADFQLRRVMDRVVDDLDGLLLPGSELTGQFVGTKNDTSEGRQDSLTFATSAGSYQAGQTPVGGCARVEYEVEESDNGDYYDWIRTVTLNPLSDDDDATVETVLLSNVYSLELTYYDGTTWQDSWDTSTDSGLPKAIEVTFALAPEDKDDEPVYHRMIVPVLVEKSEDESSSGQEGQQQ